MKCIWIYITDHTYTVLNFSQCLLLISSVVDPNTLNLDPDPGFWLNLDPDPDPG